MDKKEETRRFEFEMLALPPLKMVLANIDAHSAQKPAKKVAISYKSRKRMEDMLAVVKLIERLSEDE